jgi:hypothetical protein
VVWSFFCVLGKNVAKKVINGFFLVEMELFVSRIFENIFSCDGNLKFLKFFVKIAFFY